MRVTIHATRRWAERFPGEDIAITYARARRGVGRKTRARIRASCPAHDEFMRGGFKGVYYLITPDRIVFVMVAPETVVTVFKLIDAADNNKLSYTQQ